MAEAATSDKFAQVRGFKVEIAGASGKDVDTAWESVSGGEMIIEQARTNSPGHKTVGEITLRGAMTDGRKAMCQWINETVDGKPWKRTVLITPIHLDGTLGETLELNDCFLTAYLQPRLVAGDPFDPCPAPPSQEELRFGYISWSVRP
jgi:hypothetical protein